MFRSWLLIAALAAAACGGYDAPPEIITGTLTYTQPAPDAPAATFQPLRTYYLDPLVEVWQDGEAQISQAVPTTTVTTIETNMTRLGYTRDTENLGGGQSPNADVGLRLVYLKSTYTYYYGGSYCSIYWAYYACWPTWAYAGSYTSGTVIAMMIDLKQAPPTSRVLWVASMYGVLSGSSLDNQAALNSGLDRAYGQSPYLKTSAAP